MRPIDADKAMEIIRQHEYLLATRHGSIDNGMFTLGIQQAIDEAPTLDYKDLVPQGEWECLDDGVYRCTKCHHAPIANIDDKFVLSKFCPNCGARMVNT